MAMIEINKNPTVRELRQFAGLFLVFFGLFGGLLLWRGASMQTATIVWSAAAAISVGGFLLPGFMRWVYVGMMYLAFPIGWVVSHVVLAIVLYGLMTPIGFVLRLTGRANLDRTLEPERASYWTEHDPSRSMDGYFKQF